MELFKRPITLVDSPDLPEVFICIVDPEGESLPESDWCEVRTLTSFIDLVTPVEGKVVIIACPDNQFVADQVRLVVENGMQCGVSIVLVSNVTTYSASAAFESSLWQVRKVDFVEWKHEADEAERAAEIERRSLVGRDERRLEDNSRADGSFKKVASNPVTVEDDAPDILVL